jgi:hypothetical protein
MTFTKRLRDGVRKGEITCSVRFWLSPRVKVGGRYPMEEGEIEVDSIELIGLPDITPELACESGLLSTLPLCAAASCLVAQPSQPDSSKELAIIASIRARDLLSHPSHKNKCVARMGHQFVAV